MCEYFTVLLPHDHHSVARACWYLLLTLVSPMCCIPRVCSASQWEGNWPWGWSVLEKSTDRTAFPASASADLHEVSYFQNKFLLDFSGAQEHPNPVNRNPSSPGEPLPVPHLPLFIPAVGVGDLKGIIWPKLLVWGWAGRWTHCVSVSLWNQTKPGV